ncbi:hypothetical protein HYR99_10740 [Candidatus Poribacteria bacterium]|nr:hypothetical protein [Candidatus Poribacteria bacterium]
MPEDLGSILETKPQSSQGPHDQAYAPASESTQVQSLMKRYRDAYRLARVMVGFGNFIKGIGVMIAILIALGVFIAANKADVMIWGGVLLALFVGLLFYILEVLVSAQGQILKASLDSAVNTSPFLTNEHRAKIMSL